jgi:hypothetical protein
MVLLVTGFLLLSVGRLVSIKAGGLSIMSRHCTIDSFLLGQGSDLWLLVFVATSLLVVLLGKMPLLALCRPINTAMYGLLLSYMPHLFMFLPLCFFLMLDWLLHLMPSLPFAMYVPRGNVFDTINTMLSFPSPSRLHYMETCLCDPINAMLSLSLHSQ